MILDLVVVLTMIISLVRGKLSGFMETFLRFIALAVGLILGVNLTGPVADFLCTTPLDEYVIETVEGLATDEMIDFGQYIPNIIEREIESIGDLTLRLSILHFSNILMTVFAFILIVLLVWLVAVFMIKGIRKSRRSKGLIGSVDSVIGMLLGGVKGAVIVCLLLVLLLPVIGLFLPDKLPWFGDQLESSIIAGRIYDVNPLLVFMNKLPL